MSGWDSYRAVYGAELRAAARELLDHGWPVVEQDEATLVAVTGTVLDILEVPAALGRLMCAHIRGTGQVVPVAAAPTGTWYYPLASGAQLSAELAAAEGVTLHRGGATVLLPPSTVPDGWMHWRVAPALCGYAVPAADLLMGAALVARRQRSDRATSPGAQRPAGLVAAGMRS